MEYAKLTEKRQANHKIDNNVFCSFIFLVGCVQERKPVFWQGEAVAPEAKKVPTVAVLLPLSGESGKVGDSMQKAAMMAIFENPNTPLKMLFSFISRA